MELLCTVKQCGNPERKEYNALMVTLRVVTVRPVVKCPKLYLPVHLVMLPSYSGTRKLHGPVLGSQHNASILFVETLQLSCSERDHRTCNPHACNSQNVNARCTSSTSDEQRSGRRVGDRAALLLHLRGVSPPVLRSTPLAAHTLHQKVKAHSNLLCLQVRCVALSRQSCQVKGWSAPQGASKHASGYLVCILCSDARLVWTFLATQNTTDAGVPAVQTLRNRSEAADLTSCAQVLARLHLMNPDMFDVLAAASWLPPSW
jgi:hypothetical protein